MEKTEYISSYFENSLKLINFMGVQSEELEKKVKEARMLSGDENIYKDFMKILKGIKNNTKFVQERLSVLAFDLSSGDEEMTAILDKVYLQQKHLNEIYKEVNNKRELIEK